ncbi:MAG: 3-dehydroquinate synthase [Armatimonadota bacterium]
MKRTVEVALAGGRGYTIHIGPGLRHGIGGLAPFVGSTGRVVVLADANVLSDSVPWGVELATELVRAGWRVDSLGFPLGEVRKQWPSVEKMLDGLYTLGDVDRKSILIAAGGGVAGDVVGFVASLWMRGVRYVQFPTTLLAAVDSSVGGKTGIDFRSGKNLVGAFHQPSAVFVDTDCLASLPVEELRSGAAEVVKYGFIANADLLDRLVDSHGGAFWENPETLSEVIAESCRIKAEVVVADEREESGLRATLNYGHTIGHALEGATGYARFRHGEAIAIGMVSAACIGEVVGCTPPDVRCRTVAALRSLGLPWRLPDDISDDLLVAITRRDKKASSGAVRYVLADEVGRVGLRAVEEAQVFEGLARQRAMRELD